MKKGLSAVYGFLVIYLLIMAGLAAISDLASDQASLSASLQRQSGLEATKQEEHLALTATNGSLQVVNDGSVLSTVEYEVARYGSSNEFTKVDATLPVGANVTLSAPSSASQVGVTTQLGNLFWESAAAGTLPNSCPAGATTLTTASSPPSAGWEEPPGVSVVCIGELLKVAADPAVGYAFSAWAGGGQGSYTGGDNPASADPLGEVSETATFDPSVVVQSLTPPADGVSSGGPTHAAYLSVFGAPQDVSFSAAELPPGLSVSFQPDSENDSLSGVTTEVSYSFSGTEYGADVVPLVATGADGQSATVDLDIQTTPPDGSYSAGYALYPQGTGYPMQHKVVYFAGDYFLWFGSEQSQPFQNAYLPVFYGKGWSADKAGSLGTEPVAGYAFDVAQRSNEVLFTDSEIGSADLCYNLAVVSDGALHWLYGGGSCGGPTIQTTYTADGYDSGLIDEHGTIWAAAATLDADGGGHFEVFESANDTGLWSEVYVSPSFGQGATAVPQLLQLANGGVALLYTAFTPSSPCGSGEYLLFTTDGGFSWEGPYGPFMAAGSSLCYDRSSGAAIGDTVYAGGVNGAGELAYLSYDYDNGAVDSGVIESSADYAALGSVGSTLVMAYSAGDCSGGHEASIAWSSDGGATWQVAGGLACVADYMVVASPSNTYQVAIASDYPSDGLYYGRYIFYTV